MQRRRFLKRLAGALGAIPVLAASAPPRPEPPLLLACPVAGFQFHAGRWLWPALRRGDALDLRREPDNRHDPDAIAVWWGNHQLGYLPARDNRAPARRMDAGAHLVARITRLRETPNPWQRVRIEVRQA